MFPSKASPHATTSSRRYESLYVARSGRKKTDSFVGQSKDICCQSLYKIRGLVIDQTRQNRKNSATAKSAGVSLDELKRLRAGQFDGLNCAAIVKKLEEGVFGPKDGDDGSTGGMQRLSRAFII